MEFKTAQNDLLTEIANIKEALEGLKKRIQNGKPVGAHSSLDASKFNYLLGQYAMLAVQKRTEETDTKELDTTARPLLTVPELISDHQKWEATRKQAAKHISQFADQLGEAAKKLGNG